MKASEQVIGYMGHKCGKKGCKRISQQFGPFVEGLYVFKSTQAVANFIKENPEFAGFPPDPLKLGELFGSAMYCGAVYLADRETYNLVSKLTPQYNLEEGTNLPVMPLIPEEDKSPWFSIILSRNPNDPRFHAIMAFKDELGIKIVAKGQSESVDRN